MKSSLILSILSTICLASANPLIVKRGSSPGGCRPAQHNIYVDKKDSGSLLNLKIVGNNLQAIFAPVSGKVYASVQLNIGSSIPNNNNYATFNSNQYCSIVNAGASALCTVPLASLSVSVCTAADVYIGARASFTSGSVGWLAGPCYAASCKNDWSMYSRFRFDCSGTSGGGTGTTTSIRTVTVSQGQAVTKTATATVTARTTQVVTMTTTVGTPTPVTRTVTGTTTRVVTTTTTAAGIPTPVTRVVTGTTTRVVTTTTTAAGIPTPVTRVITGTTTRVVTTTTTAPGIPTPVTRTVTGTTTQVVTTTTTAAGILALVTRTVTGIKTQFVTQPTIVTVLAPTTSVQTVTVTGTAPAVSTCAASQTGYCSSGTGISVVNTLLGAVTNLFSCSQESLLTGTYGVINVRSSSGSLLRVGTVFIKLQVGNTLFVRATADPGYILSSVGASANCNLLGTGGLNLNSCPLFGLCSVLNSVENTSVSGLLNLGTSGLTSALTCLLGPLQLNIQGIVRKVVVAGGAC